MRLLHTSDWHLGRTFHGASLLDEQAQAVDRIVEMVSEGSIELVVVAGDLYDRAFPPAEAVDLFGDAIDRLRSTGAAVVAISGNHDSSIRVGVHDRILAPTGVTIRGDVSRATEPVMLESADGGPPVAVYPLPYLDPTLAGPILAPEPDPDADPDPNSDVDAADAAEEGSEPDATSRHRLRHDEVTRLATDRIRADLTGRNGARSVVVAHTFVEGGVICESERELTVGNIEHVGVDAFAGFDYVALGHLHGSQERDGPRVAYSGTPLPYSFSEEDHVKSVRVVEMATDGALAVEVVPLGVGRSLRTIEGTLDDLLGNAELVDAEPARVRVILTDAHLPMQAMARLRDRFPFAAELRHRPGGVEPGSIGATERDAADRAASPLELTVRFWAEQHGTAAGAAEAELLTTALDAVNRSVER
ncbi:MAG TPA: exonuclease SbcCD subunit D [Acidimicrobiia bacterium]|nr:exonuclease SbcCD subunit D [Acidimicrobiia bacterium]